MIVLRFISLVFVLLSMFSCNRVPDEYDAIPDEGQIIDFFSDNIYYYHFAPNSFIKDGQNRKAIASESLEDVELSARLGFRLVEANIWQTSDNQFVCIHGSNGTFGPEVKSVDDNVITTEELRGLMINSVSLEWIKKYVRYDSDYEEYQSTIPSLEEFCEACKRNNIGILAGVAGKRKAVEICTKYLNDNVVIYGPPSDIRAYFKGYVFTWNNKSGVSTNELIDNARSFGSPYLCSLGETVISEMKKRNELQSFLDLMHKEHFLVGWASVYSTELNSMEYNKMGMDFSAAGHEVNSFDSNYELYSLEDIDYYPSTSGVISDGSVALSLHDSVSCGSSDVISVGKGSLTIQFKGTIRICFGSMGNRGDRYELNSNGNEMLVFTDYFFNNNTTLSIESLSDSTVISHFEYLTALC